MEPAAIPCPHCGAALEPGPAGGLVVCKHCGAETDPAHPVPIAVAVQPAATVQERVPLPPRFEVVEEPGALLISWPWFSVGHLLIAAALATVMVFLLLSDSTGSTGDAVWWCCAAFGVAAGYSSLAHLVNRTVVEARKGTLSVKHGPLPWRGGGTWSPQTLAQLYVERVETDSEDGTVTTFSLHANLVNGQRRTLLSGLASEEQALWLEQALEKRYGIVDELVPGEVGS